MSASENEARMLRSLSARLGIPNIVETLATVPASHLQPILINAARERAARKTAPDILAEYEARGEFFGVSAVNLRLMHEFTTHFYKALGGQYDPVGLSPITPLGLNSVLSRVSQDVTLSTIRSSEVVSDPTTALALECATRRKRMLVDPQSINLGIHLATACQVLRLQPFEQDQGYLQHFRLFGLCSGGKNVGRSTFATEAIRRHISTWLEFVSSLKAIGWEFTDVEVRLSDIRVLESLISQLALPQDEINRHSLDENYDLFKVFSVPAPTEVEHVSEITDKTLEGIGASHLKSSLSSLEDQIMRPVREQYPYVRCCIDLNRKAGLGYYQDSCYHIFAKTPEGRCVQLADGGTVNWLQLLLASKKERMVTSGFGCELIHNLFCPTP